MPTYENILYQVENGRARITLNRPEKRNALSIDLVEELRDALWEADDDKSVHCVVLKGSGSSFCAGYDLTASRKKLDDGVMRRRGLVLMMMLGTSNDSSGVCELYSICISHR